jgi:halorhodopsin
MSYTIVFHPVTVARELSAAPLVIEPAPEALNDVVLSSSLWLMVALMGTATLLFVYMTRNVSEERARLISVVTIGIPAVSVASYFGLASGLTLGSIEVGGRTITTMWGRYLTWTFSTPLILIALGLLADSPPSKILAAVVFDVAMCVTGLAAALTATPAYRWIWFAISSAFFVVVLYVLLVEWPRDAATRSAAVQNTLDTLRTLTVVLWVGYPLVWALGTEGLALIPTTGLTSWAYSLLDVGAKAVFAFLLLRFVAEDPDAVRSSTGTATPADD